MWSCDIDLFTPTTELNVSKTQLINQAFTAPLQTRQREYNRVQGFQRSQRILLTSGGGYIIPITGLIGGASFTSVEACSASICIGGIMLD